MSTFTHQVEQAMRRRPRGQMVVDGTAKEIGAILRAVDGVATVTQRLPDGRLRVLVDVKGPVQTPPAPRRRVPRWVWVLPGVMGFLGLLAALLWLLWLLLPVLLVVAGIAFVLWLLSGRDGGCTIVHIRH
jgi:hypothetical protein